MLLDDAIDVGVAARRAGDPSEVRRAGASSASGINLTHLYHGKISLVEFMIERELGAVSKMYRGHASGALDATSSSERREKPWIAAVETFAIGGACQWLLVMDRVIAEAGSYFNLPARKEGIIPGSRQPAAAAASSASGSRARRSSSTACSAADSPEGRLIADEVVAERRDRRRGRARGRPS